MSRVKLPGKFKYKKILLIILILIAIGIISYQAWETRNVKKNENQEQEEIINSTMEEKNSSKDNEVSTKINDDKINMTKGNNYSTKEKELYNQAYELFFNHEYANAINKADELILEFPDNPTGYNIRGIARAYNGDYDGAMKDIDNSLSIDGNYGYARFNKALTYELYGDMDKALESYNKALEIEDYVWSYYGIASIYGRKGDVSNTMIYLNKAIQLDENVKRVAKSEEDFNPVKGSEEFKKAIYN